MEEDDKYQSTTERNTERRQSSSIGGGPGSPSGCFTLIVFDTKSGKITCSLVSKDRGPSSDGVSTTSDVVKSLNEEMSKMASKSIVSAGCFNVWNGLFK